MCADLQDFTTQSHKQNLICTKKRKPLLFELGYYRHCHCLSRETATFYYVFFSQFLMRRLCGFTCERNDFPRYISLRGFSRRLRNFSQRYIYACIKKASVCFCFTWFFSRVGNDGSPIFLSLTGTVAGRKGRACVLEGSACWDGRRSAGRPRCRATLTGHQAGQAAGFSSKKAVTTDRQFLPSWW